MEGILFQRQEEPLSISSLGTCIVSALHVTFSDQNLQS